MFVRVHVNEISNKLMYLGSRWRYHDNEKADNITNSGHVYWAKYRLFFF